MRRVLCVIAPGAVSSTSSPAVVAPVIVIVLELDLSATSSPALAAPIRIALPARPTRLPPALSVVAVSPVLARTSMS